MPAGAGGEQTLVLQPQSPAPSPQPLFFIPTYHIPPTIYFFHHSPFTIHHSQFAPARAPVI